MSWALGAIIFVGGIITGVILSILVAIVFLGVTFSAAMFGKK